MINIENIAYSRGKATIMSMHKKMLVLPFLEWIKKKEEEQRSNQNSSVSVVHIPEMLE